MGIFVRQQIAAGAGLVPLGEIFLGGDVFAGLVMLQPLAADMGGQAERKS